MTSTQPRDPDGRFGEMPHREWDGNLAAPPASPAPRDQWTGSYRDQLPDDEYNDEFTFASPPKPRNPRQIVSFWYNAAKRDPEALAKDIAEINVGIGARFDNPERYYARETGANWHDFPGWTRKQKTARLREAGTQWCRENLRDPREVDSHKDIALAIQMHMDSTWLDAQYGLSVDDPDSATATVGRMWQTASGRTPRQLVEEFRLHNVHNTFSDDLYDPTRPMWRGGRTYLPSVWPKRTKVEIF